MDPEQILRQANTRFLARFEDMLTMHAANLPNAESALELFAQLTPEEKEKFWKIAKSNEAKN
ncbi:MAG: hypothetical protein EOP06_13270 [Proteobacteria bacterium]|nr:MAG: hypothetical protein EOP06_13270 [Pseudomonadota bacterium]